MKPKGHAKKRRKSTDPNYRPGMDTQQSSQPFDPSAGAVIVLMDAHASPARKAAVRSTNPETVAQLNLDNPQFLTPKRYIASSPGKSPLSKHLITPTHGSILKPARTIETDSGDIVIFLSQDKVQQETLKLPAQRNPAIDQLPIPKVNMNGYKDVPISKASLKALKKELANRKRNGQSPRTISQRKLMGDVGANNALKLAGFNVDENTGQWLHLLPHSLLGDQAQCPENLGLGTRFSNAAMELVNPVLSKILETSNIDTIYMTVTPTWVKGYENIRLLESISYEIKDAPENQYTHRVKYRFDTLSLDRISKTEFKIHETILLNKFKKKKDPVNDERPVLLVPLPSQPPIDPPPIEHRRVVRAMLKEPLFAFALDKKRTREVSGAELGSDKALKNSHSAVAVADSENATQGLRDVKKLKV